MEEETGSAVLCVQEEMASSTDHNNNNLNTQLLDIKEDDGHYDEDYVVAKDNENN